MLSPLQDFIESLDVTSLWPGVLTGLVGLGGGLWLLAGKPVMSTVVQRLDRGLTRSFLLEKAITTALSREYQAPPVRSGLIGKISLDMS